VPERDCIQGDRDCLERAEIGETGRYDRFNHGDMKIKEDSGTIALLIETFIGIGCFTLALGLVYLLCRTAKRCWK
jgi:hypothetical protein